MKKNIPSLTVLFNICLFCMCSCFKWFLLIEERGQKHLETTGLHTTTSSQSVLESAGEVFPVWSAASLGVLCWRLPPGQGGPGWGRETLWGTGSRMQRRKGWTRSRPWVPGLALEPGCMVERNTSMPWVSAKGFSHSTDDSKKITLVLVVVVLFICFYHYIFSFWPSNPCWMNRWTNEWMNEMICKVLCNSNSLGIWNLIIE